MSTGMTKAKKAVAVVKAAPPLEPNAIPVTHRSGESVGQALANAAVHPAVNASIVMRAYQGNLLTMDTSIEGLVNSLTATMDDSKGGDLSTLEAMLIGQATALQTIFTSMAVKAQVQTSQRNMEALLGLALKAQAQSRATITALVDLKHPKQAMFVKQANIANGPQQVNNGVPVDPERSAQAREAERPNLNIKELELNDGQWLDTGATGTTVRTDPHLEAVGTGHGADKRRR